MAKITKSLPGREPSYAVITDLLASNVTINGTQKTVLDHIKDDDLHLTQAEKDIIEGIMTSGAGISIEELKKITDLINTKAEKTHEHFSDKGFYILASQVTETADRKFVSKSEKEALTGITDNIQTQLNIVKLLSEETMKFKGRYNDYSSMIASNPNPSIGDTVFIDNDETQEGASTIYCFKDRWIRVKKDKGSSGWTASNIAPADKKLLWVDVSTLEPVLKWFNGAAWIDISGLKNVPASKVTQEKDLHFVSDQSLVVLNNMSEHIGSGSLMYKGIVLGGGATGANIDDKKIGIDTTFSSLKIAEDLAKKQPSMGYTPEDAARKGKASGYAPLNSDTKVPRENIYDSNFVVADEAARLAITTMVNGNTCYEEDTTKTFTYSSGAWRLTSKGDSVLIGRNNFVSTHNPAVQNDVRTGYLPGSIWVNTVTKKSYICTDSTQDVAQWDLMGGQVNLNVCEIIPFLFDETLPLRLDGQTKFILPNFREFESYIEVSLNGQELVQDRDYKITNDSVLKVFYLEMLTPTEMTDVINGEIFQADVNKVDEYMTKNMYDSNYDGKVDRAEIADITKKISEWSPATLFCKDQLILKNNSILVSKDDHASTNAFNQKNWTMLIGEAIDLNKFTTDDLKEATDRKYVTAQEKVNIGQLPSVFQTVTNNSRQIAVNVSNIATLTSQSSTLKNRLDYLRFTQLIDTPSSLTKDAFLKVNFDGTEVTQISNPTFPIKSIIDSSSLKYNSIDILKFKHMEMTKHDITNGIFEFSLRAKAIELLDMPTVHQHGKVLVSDVNNQKFVLANKEELTMSVENFHKTIEAIDWVKVDTHYETTIFHNMSSEALVISFVDELKDEDKSITYKILDKNNIKAISNSNKILNCTINCALGAGNGYWQYLMDWSKIDFVDDSKIRLDRAYSSDKVIGILKNYALKNDYYTRAVCDSKYADIMLQHKHDNKAALDNIGVNTAGDITFNSKRLLTEMNPKTISIEEINDNPNLTEIYNFKTVYVDNSLQAILASEILVQNTSTSDITFKVTDSGMDILLVILKPNEIQKYHLGISNKIKIYAKGIVKTMLTVSAF